jgi:hypothetical protein
MSISEKKSCLTRIKPFQKGESEGLALPGQAFYL